MRFSDLRRREFITLVGSAAASWPLAARAQPPGKIPRLGVLLYSNPQADPQIESFRRGLRDLGYIDGQDLAIEYRYAEGRPEKLPELAAELAHLKPNVMLAIGGDVAPFAVKATQTIPIVFAISADAVQLGLVASLARPGGNATGVTFLQDDLASKRLELLKEAAPRISRVAFLWIRIIATTSCAKLSEPRGRWASSFNGLKCAALAIWTGHFVLSRRSGRNLSM